LHLDVVGDTIIRQFPVTDGLALMVETILIFGFSLALFVYWFRYTVLLLINEEPAEGNTTVIGQLSVLESREALRGKLEGPTLDRVQRALDRDYRMLRYLLDHAAGMGLRPFEHYLLLLDYGMMRVWYRLSRTASQHQARRALDEMAAVVTYIAYRMGERSAGFSQV
jgi:hypothetical protein